MRRTASIRRHRHVRVGDLLRRARGTDRSGTGASPRRRTAASESACESRLRERGGRDRVAHAGDRLVAAAVRGLADRDERVRVARLDPLVRGQVELRVGRRADDLVARELRRQEELEVRLVPDRPARRPSRSWRVAVVARAPASARTASGCSGSSAGGSASGPRSPTSGVPEIVDHHLEVVARRRCRRARRGRRAGTPGRRRSAGTAGFVGAICDQSAGTWMTEAFAFCAASRFLLTSGAQRKLVSS